MSKLAGIYQIRNTVNEKRYIGSAAVFARRWGQHREQLRKGKHHARHLQAAWNKYGEKAFIFEPLITCTKSMLIHYEQQFLDQWSPEYNSSPTAGNTVGVACSPEKKAKLRKAHTGKVLSPDHKAKVVAALAEYRKTDEYKEMCRERITAVAKLPQTREAARKRMTEMVRTPEMCAKISASKKGKKANLTPEGKASQRAAVINYNKTREISDAFRANMSEAQKRRGNIELFEHDGRSQSVSTWATEYGLCRHVLRKRLNAGWSIEKALITTVKGHV